MLKPLMKTCRIPSRRLWSQCVQLGLCVSQLTLISLSAMAADWPMGRGNQAGTGATSDALPPQPELLWEYSVDGLGFDAGPIIAAGSVFAADHSGHVLALDLATGKPRWQLELETGFVASPAYRDGRLYAGDYDGVLHAFDAQTGQELWKHETGMEIDASPNFHGDKLLFTSQNGKLIALDAVSGRLLWEYETGDQLQCGATLAGDQTFLGGCDAHLHIVDVKTGQRIGDPLSIDAPTGSTPSVLGERVFVPTYAGEIFCFKLPTFELQWRFKNPKLADEFKNSVAVADGLAVAASRNKRVFAINVETGQVVWEQTLQKRCDASPVIAAGQVVVASADGRLSLFDLKTGEPTWMFEVKPSFIGAPAVGDGKLVVANDRGTVFCFGKK